MYKTFTIPKIPVKAIALNKTTGFQQSGKPIYLVEFKKDDKVWAQEISYKVFYDTIGLNKEIDLMVFQKTSYLFCGLSILSFIGLIVFGSPFAKLVLRLKDEVF